MRGCLDNTVKLVLLLQTRASLAAKVEEVVQALKLFNRTTTKYALSSVWQWLQQRFNMMLKCMQSFSIAVGNNLKAIIKRTSMSHCHLFLWVLVLYKVCIYLEQVFPYGQLYVII